MLASSSIGPESTVAVIYRTNAQSRHLEEACVQSNLPYVIRGGAGGFYKRAEVKDCLCFLRWLYNGNDESAMLRAFGTPSRGLGDKALIEFKEYCTAVDNFYRQYFPGEPRPSKLDVLISMAVGEGNSATMLSQGAPEPSEYISKRALKNFVPFAAQMRDILEKAYNTPVDSLLFTIIDGFNLVAHFDSISKSKSEFAERRENVQELRQATKRYSGSRPALVTKLPGAQDVDIIGDDSPLGNFLDDVALVSDIAAGDGSAESDDARLVVNLMTIHASKGMEFDAVFVVGNEEGTLPSSLSIQEGEDSIALEEEKRLCYVAMTRAKTYLILTWRKEVTMFSNWSDYGSKTSSKERSRFLDALVKNPKEGKAKNTKSSSATKSKDADSSLRQRKSYSNSGHSLSRRTNLHDQALRKHSTMKQRNRTTAPTSLQNGASSRMAPRSDSRVSSTRQERAVVRKTRTGITPQQPSLNSVSPRGDTTSSRQTAAPEEAKPFDSTLFFPVGSDVIHTNFGKGMVLQPPPADGTSKLLVRVKFDNGRTMEFPADGYDLVPVF